MNSILLSELMKQRDQQGLPSFAGIPSPMGRSPLAMQLQPASPPMGEPERYNALTNGQPARGDVKQGYRPPGRVGAFLGIKRA